MEVFEIEWRVKEAIEADGETGDGGDGTTGDGETVTVITTKTAFSNTKTEAMRVVGNIATTGAVLDGDPTVYKCELDVPSGHVATIFALLNGDIKPIRRAIVHGQLPLPLQG